MKAKLDMITFQEALIVFASLKNEMQLPSSATLKRIEKRIIETAFNSDNSPEYKRDETKDTTFIPDVKNVLVWIGTFINNQSVLELAIDKNGKLIRKLSTN